MKLDMYRRFSFIESRLYWAEGLTATALAEAFGISRQSAQAVIEKYRQQHPNNMLYDAAKKQHIADESFEPHYIRKDSSRFFDAVRGQALVNMYAEDVSWSDIPFEDASRNLKPNIGYFPALVDALIKKHVITIYYYSKKRVLLRDISPHHLVYADGRYHVRAYWHDEGYRDFVLSRISYASYAGDDGVSDKHDREWHQRITLKFKLNPALPDATKQAMQKDYTLKEGVLNIPCRQALALYIERKMLKHDAESKLPLWLFEPIAYRS
jgi:hypothetical protein